MHESARGSDRLRVTADMGVADQCHARTHWLIDRWDADAVAWAEKATDGLAHLDKFLFERYKIAPYLTTEIHGNLITTVGLNRLGSLLIAGGGQAITNTSARIGAGNGAGTAAVGDTDLSASSGSSNRWFQVMAATYPQQSNGVLTLQSSFASADGNFAWNEFGIDVGTPTVSSGSTVGALLFNHKTSIAQGTKAAGQVWTATATITFS